MAKGTVEKAVSPSRARPHDLKWATLELVIKELGGDLTHFRGLHADARAETGGPEPAAPPTPTGQTLEGVIVQQDEPPRTAAPPERGRPRIGAVVAVATTASAIAAAVAVWATMGHDPGRKQDGDIQTGGSFTPAPPQPTKIPAMFSGQWRGTLFDRQRKDIIPVRITLTAKGTTGRVDYPEGFGSYGHCSGDLRLTRVTLGGTMMRLQLTLNAPCPRGEVLVFQSSTPTGDAVTYGFPSAGQATHIER